MELEARGRARRHAAAVQVVSALRAVGAGLVIAGLVVACQAPMQRVQIHLEPSDSRVYVDGDELEPGTRHVELRRDEPHVVLAKRDGYRPRQVVLEPARDGATTRLEPAEVRLELEPLVPTERAIRIEAAD